MWRTLIVGLLWGSSAAAVDARVWAKSICDIVDRYHEGSYHYVECLEHIEGVDPQLDLEQTIDFVCSAVDRFPPLQSADRLRCYSDARAKLKAEALSCAPEYNVLSKKTGFPPEFPELLQIEFRSLAERWQTALQSPSWAIARGLVTEMRGAAPSCLDQAYGVSLEAEKYLREALQECVFLANPRSEDAQWGGGQLLADEFVRAHWRQYTFRKLINVRLTSSPATGVQAPCILEMKNPTDPSIRFFMAGYALD